MGDTCFHPTTDQAQSNFSEQRRPLHMVQSGMPLPPGKTGMTGTPWLDPVMGQEANRASGGFLHTDMQMGAGDGERGFLFFWDSELEV